MKTNLKTFTTLVMLGCLTLAGMTQAATLTTLGVFDHGEMPFSTPTLSLDGTTLYGTTQYGGTYDCGAIYSVSVTGGPITILASFDGANGANPMGTLTLSADGTTLYGTAAAGGDSNNDGTVFSVPVGGGDITTLAKFNQDNGMLPNAALTLVGSSLYGTTVFGGPNGSGTIFSVPVGGGDITTVASFNDVNGSMPRGTLAISADGTTLYGTTQGSDAGWSYGTVFSVSIGDTNITTLANFGGANYNSYGSLLRVGSTLYGTTWGGGANDAGTVFSVPVTGGSITTLGSFNWGPDDPIGSLPSSADPLTLVGSTLYGTAAYDGLNNYGTVFSIPLSGGDITMLATFEGYGLNGATPYSGLALSTDGTMLYGTTSGESDSGYGTVFSLSLSGGGDVAAVPEPSTWVLLCLGAVAIGGTAYRKHFARS